MYYIHRLSICLMNWTRHWCVHVVYYRVVIARGHCVCWPSTSSTRRTAHQTGTRRPWWEKYQCTILCLVAPVFLPSSLFISLFSPSPHLLLTPTLYKQYIPNEYAVQIAVEFPNLFVPFGSVNPYRHDAIQELEKCAQLGVTIIKWLVSQN